MICVVQVYFELRLRLKATTMFLEYYEVDIYRFKKGLITSLEWNWSQIINSNIRSVLKSMIVRKLENKMA